MRTLEEIQADILLKYPESDPREGDPWKDDVLDRQNIAEKLTNMIRNQSESIVIGLHGDWGTGKTFLLKRWQCDLKKQNAKAIYFNAWEDDFIDDPFIAIIGQLKKFFEKEFQDKDIKKFEKIAKSLIVKNVKNMVEKHIGIVIPDDMKEEFGNKRLNIYLQQKEEKEEFKNCLSELSLKSINKNETQYPLVFIIDEIDRCRPTFAIELLENIKHIFDIDNVIFVFGLNRNELCNSIKSVYGNINANTYLRRFFDLELNIPEPDYEKFYLDRANKQGLVSFFQEIAEVNSHSKTNFDFFGKYFACFSKHARLSLRDIEHCIKMTILVAKNMNTDSDISATLMSVMILLKLKKPSLYRDFINRKYLGGEVVNYLDELFFKNTIQDQNISDSAQKIFYLIEAEIYLSSENHYSPRYHMDDEKIPYALTELKKLSDLVNDIKDEPIDLSQKTSHFKYLSKRTKNSTDKIKINNIINHMQDKYRPIVSHKTVKFIANLIDLY